MPRYDAFDEAERRLSFIVDALKLLRGRKRLTSNQEDMLADAEARLKNLRG